MSEAASSHNLEHVSHHRDLFAFRGRLGTGSAPQKSKDVRPVYPRESLRAGDEGVVFLELSVTASGTVAQARILWSRCKRLEQAAVTAARQWQYAQMRINGKPVPFMVVAAVPFRLPPRFKGRAGRVGACKWTEPPKPITDWRRGALRGPAVMLLALAPREHGKVDSSRSRRPSGLCAVAAEQPKRGSRRLRRQRRARSGGLRPRGLR